ncbi:preprotein translocase subunit SecG [Bdellovibrio sp. HCB2-146]|uniref:preprotein translocase subunit SecG n=1 Tax=Bdellovibrio sp. HCB2-146 TaxID=3394362 RepID=UPI0039BC308C
MTTFIGILHIIVALVLIVLVLIQDSKSDGALGMGGSSGSNSLLGATGAQTLAGKMTVWSAVIFAITCLTLSVLTASNTKSVVDSLPLPTAPAAAPATTAPADAAAPAATEAAPAATEAAPAASPAK